MSNIEERRTEEERTQSPREILDSDAWRSAPTCTRLHLRDRIERRQAIMERSNCEGAVLQPRCHEVLCVNPPNLVNGEFRDSSVCNHGLTLLGGLEVPQRTGHEGTDADVPW